MGDRVGSFEKVTQEEPEGGEAGVCREALEQSTLGALEERRGRVWPQQTKGDSTGRRPRGLFMGCPQDMRRAVWHLLWKTQETSGGFGS